MLNRPPPMWSAIIEKLEELEQDSEALDVGADGFDDADNEPYDPTEFIDDDEGLISAPPAVTSTASHGPRSARSSPAHRSGT